MLPVIHTHTHTCTEVELINLSAEFRTRVTVHAVQLLTQKAFREQESYETLTLEPDARGNMIIPVVVGRVNKVDTYIL